MKYNPLILFELNRWIKKKLVWLCLERMPEDISWTRSLSEIAEVYVSNLKPPGEMLDVKAGKITGLKFQPSSLISHLGWNSSSREFDLKICNFLLCSATGV